MDTTTMLLWGAAGIAAIVFSVWITFLPADIAYEKGHSWFLWLILAFVCWPAAMVGALVISPSGSNSKVRRRGFMPHFKRRFDCPSCGESIPVVAKSCRFCDAAISDADRSSQNRLPPKSAR